MTHTTPNLVLTTFNTAEDAASQYVYDYINAVSGSMSTQNLGKIDAFAGTTSACLVTLSGSIAGLTTKANKPNSAVIQIVPITTIVTPTNGIFYLRITTDLAGLNLTRAIAFANTSGSGGDTTIQVRNMTKYPSNDALSTAITIPNNSVLGTAGTVNTSYDDVSLDDQIRIQTLTSGSPLGLQVALEYSYP